VLGNAPTAHHNTVARHARGAAHVTSRDRSNLGRLASPLARCVGLIASELRAMEN